MKDRKEFYNLLAEIDGKPFAEYERLLGDFDFARYVIKCTKIGTANGAENPVFNIRIPQSIAELPGHLYDSPVRRTALEDFLTRNVAESAGRIARFNESGWARRNIIVAEPGQKILPRTSVVVTKEYIDVRLRIALPYKVYAAGEHLIDGEMARKVFFDDLPEVVSSSIFFCNIDLDEAESFVNGMEDADRVRQTLSTLGFVSFVGEGSLLAREQDSDLPDYDHIAPFEVSEAAQTEIDVPNAGKIIGLGIPAGLTIVLGNAANGRKDFMSAIAAGVFNHIPGDGRETVVTVSDAVQIAADRGRSVQEVNITPFLSESETGNPASYSTRSADSFISQAAATIEALEVGARVLIVDENTSAPAFLTTDARIAGLLGKTPRVSLAQRARQMVDELGISLVIGGENLVAEYIPFANTVLKVEDFQVTNITEEAKALNLPVPPEAPVVNLGSMLGRSRWIMPSSIDAAVGSIDQVIEAIDLKAIQFGRSVIELDSVPQIADVNQTLTIGLLLYYAKLRYMQEGYPLREMLDMIDRDLSSEGLGTIARDLRGDLARPRRYELAAALNRLPTFRVSHATE
ncbi:MAG TPA: ABC-ATPase domain-containing protein [Pontiellaceae bacterium]|nr:ABC-ATPase domain-containing protein [Pontiellaceae bacterium]HPR83185.1 ABC-ATPase domain-containing protein [Pontiellaceae bacterium]